MTKQLKISLGVLVLLILVSGGVWFYNKYQTSTQLSSSEASAVRRIPPAENNKTPTRSPRSSAATSPSPTIIKPINLTISGPSSFRKNTLKSFVGSASFPSSVLPLPSPLRVEYMALGIDCGEYGGTPMQYVYPQNSLTGRCRWSQAGTYQIILHAMCLGCTREATKTKTVTVTN